MEEDVPEERAPFRTDEGLCASRPRACRPDCLLEAAASLSSPSDMDVIHNMAIAESDASESHTPIRDLSIRLCAPRGLFSDVAGRRGLASRQENRQRCSAASQENRLLRRGIET